MATDNPNEMLNKLQQALVIVSRGDPIIALRAELETKFEAIATKFSGIDKATDLQHQDLVRVPTQVDRAVDSLHQLLEKEIQKNIGILDGKVETSIAHLNGKIEKEIGVTTEKFTGVANQFSQNDKALTAALQAQEKQAIATNDSNTAASTKMEGGFSAMIRQQADILTEVRRTYDAQLTAINSRLDKGEGVTSVSSPQLASTISGINTSLTTMQDTVARSIASMANTNASAISDLSSSLRKVERSEAGTTSRSMGRGEIVSYVMMGVLVLSQIIVVYSVLLPHANTIAH
jgi:hypothetical protein